jgi:hemerythrin-like domain-containing protein
MLRDRNLVPLSHQHQQVLALCVRLDRALQAGPVDLASWQEEIRGCYEQEISGHFEAEERVVFPAASEIAELQAIVKDLRREHVELRQFFAKAAERNLALGNLSEFVEKLAHHIRKEERELFEGMQKTMSRQQLAVIGAALDEALKPAPRACSLPRKPRPTGE